MLTGERVHLRAFNPDEFEMVRGWFAEPARVVGPHQPFWAGIGEQVLQALEYDSTPNDQEGTLAITLLDSQQVIGMIRYNTVSLAQQMVAFYEIGYAITEFDERRKGYAREACALLIDYLFETYSIRRVGASTLGANEPSARLLEDLGFTHEGAIRKAAYIDDEWSDYFWYGLLREEWVARRNGA